MSRSAPTYSAEKLSAYINKVELPLRSGAVGSRFAGEILRRGRFVGSVIEHFRSLERTMSYAREHISLREDSGESVASGTVFVADRLEQSKGRFTRAWHAPEGGLWGSVIHVNTLLPNSRMLVPIGVGIACCEAARQMGAHNAMIRWINDVLIGGKKVAGFLIEGFIGNISKEEYNLLGFGINLNNRTFPGELEPIATSLSAHVGGDVDIGDFACCFFAKLSWNLGLIIHEEDYYLREQSWSSPGGHPLIERWKELSDTVGREVLFGFDVVTEPQYRARVIGIGNDGGLRLRMADGSEITEYSGEVRYL